MHAIRFGLPLLMLLGACSSTNSSEAVYKAPVICTDLAFDLAVNRPADQQPHPSCRADNPGGEMFERERGLVGVPEGAGIVVTQVFTGLTGIR